MHEENIVAIIISLIMFLIFGFLIGMYWEKNYNPRKDYFNPEECDLIKIENEDRYLCPSELMIQYRKCLKEADKDEKKIDECYWEYNKNR